jgi:hypothetical protein
LIVELRDATIGAQIDRINTLIDDVAEHLPDAAKQLRYMAERYEYEALLAVLDRGISDEH